MGRIRAGGFKTFSDNVVQICKVAGVKVPRLLEPEPDVDPAWAQAQSSVRCVWNETPKGALVIARMLDAVAELQTQGDPKETSPK